MLHAKTVYRILRKLPIAALLLTCMATDANAQDAQDAPTLRYQAVWHSGTGSNIVTEPLNRSEFIQRGQELTSQGLRLIDVETAEVNGDRIYTGIWVDGSDGNIFDGPLTRREFRERREELRSQGLRLIDFEVFRAADGRRRFIGVWRSGSGEEKLTLPRNAEEFAALGDEFTAQGLRLVDVEVERNEGELQYRGLWREGTGSNFFTTPRQPSDFRALRDQMVADGLELIDVERIGEPGSQQFVGVWSSGDGESRLSTPRNFEDFTTLGGQQTADGKRTQDLEIFLTDVSSTSLDSDVPSTPPDDEEPDDGNSGSVGLEDLPAWLELSDGDKIIVDFGTILDEQPRITLPIGALPESVFNNDGTMSIPTNFCGLRIMEAESFTWQTITNVVIDDDPYNQSDDVQADFGDEFYLGGIDFTGAIGQCEEANDPWQFNFPLTQNSGDSPIPNLRLVIEVIPGAPATPGGPEIEFLYSN